MIRRIATDTSAPIRKYTHIAVVIAAISNSPGKIISAPNVPPTIVTQINSLNGLNGIQLLITAVMEITINVRYITVCFSVAATGRIMLIAAIITAATTPNGAAFPSEVGRNLPLILLVSDSRIVANDGYASIHASISVICIGINGNGIFMMTQSNDTSTE